MIPTHITLSPSTSASSIECVVSNTTVPSFNFSIMSHTRRRLSGSMPVVGSSRKISFGLATAAIATLSLLFIPPEKPPTRESPREVSDTCSSRRSTSASSSAAATPLSAQHIRSCSRAVSTGQKTSSCGQLPMFERS